MHTTYVTFDLNQSQPLLWVMHWFCMLFCSMNSRTASGRAESACSCSLMQPIYRAVSAVQPSNSSTLAMQHSVAVRTCTQPVVTVRAYDAFDARALSHMTHASSAVLLTNSSILEISHLSLVVRTANFLSRVSLTTRVRTQPPA